METKSYRRQWVPLLAMLVGATTYVFSVPNTWLVGTRIILLVVGILAILSYMSPERNRPFATWMAILIGGSSMAMIMQGVTNFVVLSLSAEPWLVVYVFAQTCLLIANGGNTARAFAPPRSSAA